MQLVLIATLTLLATCTSPAKSARTSTLKCGSRTGIFYTLNNGKMEPPVPMRPIDVPATAHLVVLACNMHNGAVELPASGGALLPALVGRVGHYARVNILVDNVANIVYSGSVNVAAHTALIASLVNGPVLPGSSVTISLLRVANVQVGALTLAHKVALVAPVINTRAPCARRARIAVHMLEVANVRTIGDVRLASGATLCATAMRLPCAHDTRIRFISSDVANVRASDVELRGGAALMGDHLEVTGLLRACTVNVTAVRIANVSANSLRVTNSSRLRGLGAYSLEALRGVSVRVDIRDIANVHALNVIVEDGSLLSDVIVGVRSVRGSPAHVEVKAINASNVESEGDVLLSQLSGLGPLGTFFFDLNATANVDVEFERVGNVKAGSLTITNRSDAAVRGLAIYSFGAEQQVGLRFVGDNMCNTQVNGVVRIEGKSRLMRSLLAVGTSIVGGRDLSLNASRFANIRHALNGSAFIDGKSTLVKYIFDKKRTLPVQAKSVRIHLKDAANVDVPLKGNGLLMRAEDIFVGDDAASGVLLTTISVGQAKQTLSTI